MIDKINHIGVRQRLKNVVADFRCKFLIGSGPLGDLEPFEKQVYSQNGEDGIIAAIFKKIGAWNKTFIEFGVGDGTICNTRLLKERGWSGLWMDELPNPGKQERVAAENINDLFKKHDVKPVTDLLVIDIDGNDYWIWRSINTTVARVVVIEYNARFGLDDAVQPYRSDFKYFGEHHAGASLRSLCDLGQQLGYTLIACDSTGVNAFFVESNIARPCFKERDMHDIYRPLGFPHKP